jgi:16S rRNA (cytosine1402-N4)-methyltransferase
VSPDEADATAAAASSARPPRRPRYRGRHPRAYAEKYKELAADPETLAKVQASGKTPAGTHRPVLLAEVLEALDPRPGERMVDGTLGHGGHAEAILPRLLPGGVLLGLDQDPLQLPLAEARLRSLGFGEDVFRARRSNFAGLAKVLGEEGWPTLDGLLLDLGVSSMQLDNPDRGFSYRHDGPLDMRMNPRRGESAAAWLARVDPATLEGVLLLHADEPRAAVLAAALAGRTLAGCGALADAVRAVLPPDEAEESLPRVFQALRIQVNDEFGALEALIRDASAFLAPGARVAVITFHSGEDRRIKRWFADGFRSGRFRHVSEKPVLPTPDERHANPRSRSAKLRVAVAA